MEFSQWKADTVIVSKPKGEVLVKLVERFFRKIFIEKAKSNSSEDVAPVILGLLSL